MFSILSHLSLGLLLGALCGLGMTTKHPHTTALMRSMSWVAGALFITTSAVSRLTADTAMPVELLADLVMGGVALSLVLCLTSIYVYRLQRRAQLRQVRSPSV